MLDRIFHISTPRIEGHRFWSVAFCLFFIVSSLPAHAQSTAQATTIGTTTLDAPSSLIQASDGNVYGVVQGSFTTCHTNAAQCGDIVQILLQNPFGSNTATIMNDSVGLLSTTTKGGTYGFYPANILEDPQSILYGATGYGGAGGSTNCSGYDDACGVFYQFYYDPDVVKPTPPIQVLHNFTSAESGQGGPITLGSDGNYYGVSIGTYLGYVGAQNTIYKLTPTGQFSLLATLNSIPALYASIPNQLVEGDDGYFYGTALGGESCGTVFQMDKTGSINVIATMPLDGSLGCNPVGQLVEGPDKAFYGITNGYGAPGNQMSIFRVTSTGEFTVLHTLSSAEGYLTESYGLILGSDGVLYGASTEGGGAAACSITNGCGTVFSVTTSGTFTVLYAFPGGQNGAYPNSLLQISYGADFTGMLIGGAGSDGAAGSPAGVVYQVQLPAGHQAAPVQIEMFKQSDMSPVTSASQIDPNTPLILDWQVLNAYSNTMQQCYARAHNPVDSNGEADWSGKQSGSAGSTGYSGNTIVTPQYPGIYSYSLTCGGTESAVFQLTVQNTLAITTANLPDATVGQNYSQTLTATGGTAPYTWSVTSGNLPPGLTLEGPNGIISGKPSQFGTYTFTIQAQDNSVTPETITAVLTMTVNTGLAVNPTTLPQGLIGTAYSQVISVTGGIAPYTLTIPASSLPDGLAFNAATSTISGTPTKVGTSNLTLSVADAENPQATTTQNYAITVVSTALTVSSVTLPQAGVSQQFAQQFAATGGVAPYTWTVTAGTLPQGLQLSTQGLLSGTPVQFGAGNPFTIQVADTETPPQTATATFTLPVQNTLAITSTTLPAAIVGIQYSAPVAATGGLPPYKWTAGANLDKLGLSIDPNTGVISGIPQVAGTFSGGVSITDSEGTPASTTTIIILPINSAGVAVSSTTLTTSSASAAVGQNVTFTATVSVSGGTPTGSVAFVAGTTALGNVTLNSSGIATLTTSFTNSGVYNVVASYSGDDYDQASASTPLIETVVAPSLSASISPASLTIADGASGTLTITLTSIGSYTGTVGFSCGALPAHVSCSFAPPSLTIISGQTTATDVLTINTNSQISSLSEPPNGRSLTRVYLAIGLWPFLALPLARLRRRWPRLSMLLAFAILAVGLSALGGCAAHKDQAAPGTYSIPVVLQLSGGSTQDVSVSVTVQ
jgi:uncharacterized repeat protein (TIGR03803 family)